MPVITSIAIRTNFANRNFRATSDPTSVSAATRMSKPVPRKARPPAGAARFTLVYISYCVSSGQFRQSALLSKAALQKILAPRILVRLSHPADYRLHVIQVTLERAPAGGRQTIFSLWGAAFERLRTINVACVLEFARMHAQIAVSCLYCVLQFFEGKRFVDGQRADNSQP